MKEYLNQSAVPTFSLPNLFNFLPDGFREGKMFVLDVFDCHRPPVAADVKIPSEVIEKIDHDWNSMSCMLYAII